MSGPPPYYNFIFQGEPEDIIIVVKSGTKINKLFDEYFKRIEKPNLIIKNLDNIYFIIDAKILTNKNDETIESFFKNNISSTFLVKVVNGNNHNYNIQDKKLIKGNIYSSVYEAQIDGIDVPVAIKVINKEKIKEMMMEENMILEIKDEDFIPKIEKFNIEIENMQKCQCENSVKIYDYYDTEKEFIIIMELCDETLFHVLCRKEQERGFKSEEIKYVLLQLNKVFKKMNYYNISHRDIKLNNILVKYLNPNKTKYRVLLSDYGSSDQLFLNKKFFEECAGTKLTMAPEILDDQKYNNKCDLWSLGVIIYQLYTKKFPYEGNVNKAILNQIKRKGLSVLDAIEDNDYLLKDLLSKLLQKEPDKRISWEDYYKHPFFN